MKCPTCRRDRYVDKLDRVNFEHRVCRCGLPWNKEAERRLKYWVCTRKMIYPKMAEAQRVSEEMRMECVGIVRAYRCPFDETHYHIGSTVMRVDRPKRNKLQYAKEGE